VLYLAGELTPKENARLIRHYAQCAACAALAEDLAATQQRVEAVLRTDVEAPTTLDARVMSAIRALPPQQPSWPGFLPNRRGLPRFAFALAVCCMVILGFAIGGRYSAKSVLELASLGAAHNRQITASSPSELNGSDAHQLAQQLTSLVRFPVRAADLKSEGALLVGGCRTMVDNVAMAALHYNWEGKQISLFEMDGAKRTPAALRQMGHEADSYYVHKAGDLVYVAWHSGKTDCVMVARAVPMHQLFHLACRACERQEEL
jgi:anti-sigma factor RsiW